MAKLLRLYVFIFSVFTGNFSFKKWCANIWPSLHISFANNNSFNSFKVSTIRCSGFGRVFLWFLLTANCLLASAQSFPVQLIPQVTPPPPIYFSQYADASTTNSPLRLQIILNDLEINNREIRLKVYFQGNGISFQSNDVVVGSSPLFLEGGIPLVLTNAELAPYFRFENITGISPNVYGQAIPEGAYQFCYEVYDVLTGNRLSQKSCAINVVFQNEPPFLISPRNKTLVAENNPQNIVFQWTPRSINVSNVEYELSLVEIWDTQIDPQAAFLSSPPVFQTTTTSTTYVYGPSDPLLLSGKNYAWRIQAKAKQGTEEIGLFKNQGYSEIFSFSYAGSCDLPLGIGHEVKGSTNANIFWDDFSTEVPEYTIRYRQKGNTNEWFLNKTTTNQTTLWDLKAGTTYEYQLQKKCVVTGSEWSVTKQFTTFLADNEASVYQCGITPNFSLTNKESLPKLSTGESFVAGDFPIHVLEISGSNGRFTGKGYVTIPYLNSIKVGVEFTNVLINTDKQMSEGTVVTVYDPNLASILDVDEVVETVDTISDLVAEPFEGDNDLDEMRVNFMIPRDSFGNYIKIKDGMVTITNPENGASISEPLGDDKVVVDGEGQVYHIDASGEIIDGGQIDSGGAVTSNNVEGLSTNGQLERLTAKDIQITFKEVLGEYGFDEIPSAANASIKKEYTTILDADGNDYTLAHQAVEKGQTAYVDAIIEQTGSNQYVLDNIVFKTKQGEKIPVEIRGNNTIRLTLKGRYTFENEIIYAVVPSKTDRTKQLTAGAFTLWHMTDRPVDVVLVSVSGGKVNGLVTEVAKIFKKGVATINIETQTATAELDLAVLGDNARLDIGDSGWLTNYNAEQQAVIADLKSKIDYNINKYYVFVFGGDILPTKPIGGFMPLQRQFGFVFTGNDNQNADDESKGELAKTIAHEIGHGVFALQHPFDLYGKEIEGQTGWLMDYANGSLLSHMDWKQLHNPELKFYVFQDDEDGEIAGYQQFEELSKIIELNPLNSAEEYSTYFTPSGELFAIPSTAKPDYVTWDGGRFPKGSLRGFELNSESYYGWWSGKDIFEGYAKKSPSEFYSSGNPKPEAPKYRNKPERINPKRIYTGFKNYNCDIVTGFLIKEDAKIFSIPKKIGKILLSTLQNTSIIKEGEEDCYVLLANSIGESFYNDRKGKASVSDGELRFIAYHINQLNEALYSEFENAGFSGFSRSDLDFYDLGAFNQASDYENFKNSLLNFIANKEAIKKYFDTVLLNENTTQDDLLAALSYLTWNHCKSLTLDDRINALRKLNEGKLNGKWLSGDGGEYSVLRLVGSTPNNQIEGLFLELKKNNLIGDLNQKLDDFFFGPDNYAHLINTLYKLWNKYSVFKGFKNISVADLVNNNKLIRFYTSDDKLFRNQVYDEYFESNGILHFEVEESFYKLECTPGPQLVCGPKLIDSDKTPFDLDPFEPIALLIDGKEAANLIPGAQLGETYIIPAFYFVWILNEYSNDNIKEGVEGAITIASLAVGVGEVVAAKNAIQITLALLDISVTMGDALLTNELKMDLAATPEGQKFLDAWEVLEIINVGTSVSPFAIEAAKSYIKQWDNIGDNLDIPASTKSKIDNSIDYIKVELRKIGEIIDSGNDAIGTFISALPPKTKIFLNSLTTKFKKNVVSGYLVIKLNTTEIARVTDDGIIQATKRMEVGKNIEFFAEDILTLKSNGVTKESVIIFGTNEAGVSGVLDIFDVDAKEVFKEGVQPGKIYNQKPKPDPTTYINSEFVSKHLAKFKRKASYLVTGDTYDSYIKGKPFVGRQNGQFIATAEKIDEILTKAKGNISIIEKELGIPKGNWTNKNGIYRIDVENPETLNLRIPKGDEAGANEYWLPGGKTSGGIDEAVIDQIPQSQIKAEKIL